MNQHIDPLPNFYKGTGLSKSPFEYLNAQFNLSAAQFEQLNKWLLVVEKQAAEKQLAREESTGKNRLPPNVPLPYYGTAAGGVDFKFIPTGLGVIVIVTESITGETLDLTEYDLW